MPNTTLTHETVLPPEQGSADLARLADLITRSSGSAALVTPDGTRVPLPPEVYQALAKVVDALANGLAVTLAPHDTLLTTQQAADMLDVSRPTLVKLLEQGDIPFEMRGRHRRVMLANLLDYQRAAHVRRRSALDELTRDGEEIEAVVDGFDPA
jgi:excisionase family DNA binding protein